jgi:8-oxo-dGTP diphosphatase
MRLSVAAIALNEDKVFIAKRAAGGAMGGKWEFPGGKAEDGEDPKTALAREIEEEFGVDIEVGKKIAEGSFTHVGKERMLEGYRVFFVDYRFSLTEHTEWCWAGFDEIEALAVAGDFTPSDYALLPQIRRLQNGSTSRPA